MGKGKRREAMWEVEYGVGGGEDEGGGWEWDVSESGGEGGDWNCFRGWSRCEVEGERRVQRDKRRRSACHI